MMLLRPLMVIVACTLSACGEPQPYSPPRPASLPPEAVYAGGVDGGDWMACEGIANGVLHCRIFDPDSSELRRESWLRYCPQSGLNAAGTPQMMDSVGLFVTDARLKRDRPDVVHPLAGAPAEQIEMEHELAQKDYREAGVNPDCSPISTTRP